MKQLGLALTLSLCLFCLDWRTASACTIVTMARDGQVLIGNNEDWTDPRTKMWIVPASPGEYGRVLFGFDNHFIQGGINEHGLFLDANALPPTGWVSDPRKPLFEDTPAKPIGDHILAHCATVEDVITFFKTYSVFLGGGKFVIADARGDSIVVEWAEGADRISKRRDYYQISTNIPQWNILPGKVDDARYNIAEKVILSRKSVSLPTIRAVLSATHKEWSSPTIYSYICDLKSLTVHLFNFHDFEEEYVFNLRTELKKGGREYDIPNLFPVKTYAAIAHDSNAPKLGVDEVQQKLAEGGFQMAADWYRSVKDEHRKISQYMFHEGVLQQLGFDLQMQSKSREALDVFRFNCLVFPDSADAWELFGDACLKANDAEQAIASYEKSLQLNAKNPKLENKLKGLRDRQK